LQWDVYCHVVDNFGDVGVCWRLARDLVRRGHAARLCIDDASALRWMAPGAGAGSGMSGVDVLSWAQAAQSPPSQVVIEAFGCDPPAAVVQQMAAMAHPPLWLNLEYLGAESYVERCHGLPSPQLNGPGQGLSKWFFYPGFTPATGGLLREPGLLQRREAFDRHAWLQTQGLSLRPGERVVSLFSYPSAPWPAFIEALPSQPSLLLVPPCAHQQAVLAAATPNVRVAALPWLTQEDFDHLLWSCDINAVRGEDSLVRAIWAGAPFLWQLYPQHDGAHAAKLQAFADAFGAEAVPGLGSLWRRWNGMEGGPLRLPPRADWSRASQQWRAHLASQTDLVSSLQSWAWGKLGLAG
jgi:uncharacterized repeat protein (TIGR03837 family)